MNNIKILKYTKSIIDLVSDSIIAKITIKNGKPHHEKDPAVLWKSSGTKEYWYNGVFYNDEEAFRYQKMNFSILNKIKR